MKKQRNDGFYWVRVRGTGAPQVAQWVRTEWEITGWEGALADDVVSVLSERLKPPGSEQ